jgi:hypothetical protein
LLASATEYPNSNAVIAALALKADAANPVFTGNMTISGAEPKLTFTDTDQNPDYFIGVDAGFFRIYDQTAGLTRFVINSSGVTTIAGDLIVGTIAKTGGTAAQFLKADGTIDSSTYVTSAILANYLLSATAATTYQTLANLSTDLTASATKYPSVNAVVTGLGTKQPLDADLTAIAALVGTTGFLIKTAADTWSLDTNTYLTTTSAASTYLTQTTAASTYQRLDKMVSNLLASSTEYPNSNAVLAKLALKADAANPVFTGDLTISGATPRLYFVDTDQNPDYTIFVDSGYFYIYDQTAGATKFQITPSGNAINAGTLTSTSFIKSGGTASQYLMADGSVTTFAGVTGSGTTNYLPKWTSASGIGNSIIYDSGTKIGIGTATPYGLVEINGNGNAWETAPAIRMWDTLNSKGWLIGTANNYAAGDFYIRTLPSISTNPGDTEQQFTIKHSTGNILINTATDAGYKLDVNGTGRFSGDLSVKNSTTHAYLNIDAASLSASEAGILLRVGGANKWEIYTANNDGNLSFWSAGQGIKFKIEPTGAATFSTIVTTKSVGDYRQSTSGAITGAGLFVTPASAGTYGLLVGSSFTYGDVWLQAGRTDGNTQNYNISLNASGGNVGIGTATPGFKLQVNGDVAFYSPSGSLNSIITQGSEGKGRLYLYDGGNATIGLQTNGPSYFNAGNFLIGTTTDGGFPLLVGKGRDGWQVGFVNTSSYGTTNVFFGHGEGYGAYIDSGTHGNSTARYIFKLISGNTERVVIRGDGLATFSSSITATSFFESSDSRLKTLIDESAQIAGIENLEAKLYEKNGKIELGYFAQDAEKLMPYAVTKGANGFLSLSYREVHTAKIARLEQRVAELEKQLNAA